MKSLKNIIVSSLVGFGMASAAGIVIFIATIGMSSLCLLGAG